MNKTKWIYYTVLVGLLPFFLRIIVALLANQTNGFQWLYSPDILFFGLVLGISNINELELLKISEPKVPWVTKTNGASILYIVIFSAILTITLVNELIGKQKLFSPSAIKLVSCMLATSFFFVTLSIYNNLKKV